MTSWTTPPTWLTDQVVSAADFNTYFNDNMTYLFNRPSATVLRDNNADYTTTSGAFVDIDGTNLKITLAVAATKVLLGFTGVMKVSSGTAYLDFAVDGVRVGSAGDGLIQLANTIDSGFSMLAIATVSPGSRIFKVQWGVSGGILTLRAGSGSSLQNTIPSFWAVEVG